MGASVVPAGTCFILVKCDVAKFLSFFVQQTKSAIIRQSIESSTSFESSLHIEHEYQTGKVFRAKLQALF